MRRFLQCVFFGFCLLGLAVVAWGDASEFWRFPKLPPPAEYGHLLMNRLAQKNGQKSVSFSHWSHRMKYTCRVCHLELEFEMTLNATEFTEDDNRNGRYCGACHDGKTAFGHRDEKQCDKCHTGEAIVDVKAFRRLSKLPRTPFGNRIDWVKALERGLINPKQSILESPFTPLTFDKTLGLEAAWTAIPPVIFPHKAHTPWLGCANCHPDIFNVKKKSTRNFSMNFILEQKFCGVCHWKVAFPLDDCKRCHPAMQD